MKKNLLLSSFLALFLVCCFFKAQTQTVEEDNDYLGKALKNYKQERVYINFQDEEIKSRSITAKLKEGNILVVYALSIPSSGYQWEVVNYDNKVLRYHNIATKYSNEACPAPGASVFQRIVFTGEVKGMSDIKLVYRRPWKNSSKDVICKVQIENQSESKTKFAFTPPKSIAKEVKKEDYEVKALPSSFDWRSPQNGSIVTPVKDQGTCGSCWAFGAAAGFEAKIKKKDGVTRDLSEQYAVSCNEWGMSCAGGWWVYDLWYNTIPPGESGAGAVYEEDFPYQAMDVDCNPPRDHHEQLEGWAYVDDVEDNRWPTKDHRPTTAQIKEKLYQWGPIPTALSTDDWGNYTGGVLSGVTPDQSTHIVCIVGWDDSEQCWIIKNSWGKDWGEDGYVRIGYGSHLVGDGSTYLKYDKTNPRIVYQGNEFWESLENDGKIRKPIDIKIFDAGNGFAAINSSDMTEGTHYTVSGLPSGLNAIVTRVNSNKARLTLTGTASQHLESDTKDITINFLNAAFDGINASNVENASYNLKINFMNPYKIVYEDIEDLTCTESNDWEAFDLQNGAPFGLWHSYYDYDDQQGTATFFLETYTKKALCTTSGSDVAEDRKLIPVGYGGIIDGAVNYMVTGGSFGEQHKITCAAYPDWNGKTAYAGFSMNMYGGTCYGWFRLKVNSSGTAVTILDYAYNEKPYAPIKAGMKTEPVFTPIVNFIASEDEIYAGTKVQFIDKSQRVPTSWSWSFPGGNPSSSNEKNPVVTYNTPGLYKVTLTASNSAGSDTEVKTDYILVHAAQPPVADFSADGTLIPVGASVNFTDQSTNWPKSWSWNFQGGSPSESIEQNPVVTYNNAGTYDVSLTTENDFGPNTKTKTDFINVISPPTGYCSASYGDDYDWSIKRVILNEMDYTSGRGNNGYQDNTNHFATVDKGQQYTVTVNTSADHWDDISIGVWVDWNQDKDFNDAGELIMETNQEQVYSKAFSVPTSALSGMTRMRMRVYAGSPIGSACGEESYIGEAEDCSIIVNGEGGNDTESPTIPTNLNYSNVTKTSVDLSWTASTDNKAVTGYDVMNGSTIVKSSTGTSTTVSGLTAGTEYTLKVRAKDAAGNLSGLSNAVTFTTKDDNNNDDGGELQDGVTANGNIDANDVSDMWFIDVGANATSMQVVMTCGDSDYDTYGKFNAEPTTSSNDWKGYTSGGEDNTVNNPAQGRHYIMVQRYSGEGSYSLKATITYETGGDTEAPTTPTNLSYSNTTKTTVDLSWTASSDNVGITGYDIMNGSTIVKSTTGTSTTVSGLTAGTEYTFKLRAKDAAGNLSGLSNAVTFTTKDDIPNPTYCTAKSNGNTYEHITRVQFGSIDQSSGSNGYEDFTSVSTNLNAGSTTSLSITTDKNYDNDELVVYIDYNRDGDFSDSGEEVYHNSNAKDAKTYTSNIAVPSNAVSGSTRMRIILFDQGYDNKTPCGEFDYGEVEDYMVNLTGSYQSPTAINMDNNHLKVYPNPVKEGFVTIETSNLNDKIKVYNTSGVLVKSFIVTSKTERLNLSELPSGSYLIKQGLKVKQVIIQ